MYHEIERKFLVKKMPTLKGILKIPQERYFIQRGVLFEEGLKRKGDDFIYEAKFSLSKKEKLQEKIHITKEEFERLKERGTHVLMRDSYQLSKKKPLLFIKKYNKDYRGLILAEVLFDSMIEMENFTPLPWMGKEVTDTLLGKDARLIDLDRDTFLKILEEQKAIMNNHSIRESFL